VLLESPSVSRLAEEFAPSFSAEEPSSQPAAAGQTAAGQTAGRQWSPVLKLADTADAPPLICVHPAGGDVNCYQGLARRLRSRRPVWALRARGLDAQTTPHESVEQMARDYLAEVRALPHGPYYLAGWSTGGIFAFEMARQLVAEGSELGALFFLDSPTPAILEGVDLDDHARFLVDLVEFSNWFAGTEMRVDYAQLKRRGVEAALQTVFDEAKQHQVLPSDASVDYLRRLVAVCRENSRAILQYEMRPLDRPVQLFRPTNADVLADASGKTLSADLGWGSVLGDRLAIHEVHGDHFSMMTGDNLAALGDALLRQLTSFQTAASEALHD